VPSVVGELAGADPIANASRMRAPSSANLGYALHLAPTLAGWNAVVYPMDDVGSLGELVAHRDTELVAAELAVAFIRSRFRSHGG
jgi:hypothetical protein